MNVDMMGCHCLDAIYFRSGKTLLYCMPITYISSAGQTYIRINLQHERYTVKKTSPR